MTPIVRSREIVTFVRHGPLPRADVISKTG